MHGRLKKIIRRCYKQQHGPALVVHRISSSRYRAGGLGQGCTEITGGGEISPGDNFAGDNFARGKFRHP